MIIDKLKDRVDISQVAKDLSMDLSKQGDDLVGNCITGHPSKSGKCFHVVSKGQFFHCFHCGIGGDVIKLVESVLDIGFAEATKWLSERYAAELQDDIDNIIEEKSKPKEFYGKAALYEEVFKFGKYCLQQIDKRVIPHYNYLLNERGYSEETITQSEWIYFPEDRYIRNHLMKKFPEATEEIDNLSLQGALGDKFRLGFPYRDRFGIITGFIKRNTNPKDKDRYDSTKGLKKGDLFNLHRWRGRDNLIILEGYPDALTLEFMGIKGVVALGQAVFGKKLLEGIKHFGIRKIAIALDNDGVGIENTRKLVDVLLANDINVYVVDPESLGKSKDPDEYVKANGVEKFKELLIHAENGITWKIRKIIESHDRLTASGFDDAFIESVNFWETLTSSLDIALGKKAICRYLHIESSHFADELKKIKVKRIFKEQIETIENIADKAKETARKGEPAEALSIIKNGVESLDAMVTSEEEEFYISTVAHKEIANLSLGFNTGYPSLDNYLKIPAGALTIIAGRPSHGKTTLLMNLMMNMVQMNADKRFYFFSYEEARSQIYVKLINLVAGTEINKYGNVREIQAYIRDGRKDNPKLNAAIKFYDKLVIEKNITIYDISYEISDLVKKIAWLANNGDVGCIFIDYIQKIRSKRRFNSRQLEIQYISNELLKVAKRYGLSIIMGAQFARSQGKVNRLDNLREAGDIEQDANLVLGMTNLDMLEAEKAKEGNYNHEYKSNVTLLVSVLKNRNGITNVNIPMTFQRTFNKITDITHSS